ANAYSHQVAPKVECDDSRASLQRSNVADFDVLIAEALDVVAIFLLVEAQLGRGHNLAGTHSILVEPHLQESQGIVGAAIITIKFNEGHGARGDNRDDGP